MLEKGEIGGLIFLDDIMPLVFSKKGNINYLDLFGFLHFTSQYIILKNGKFK